MSAISIGEIIAALPGPWQPHDVVKVNDTIMRVARLEGAFAWHRHDEDELFLCWDGSFRIELSGADPVPLKAGEIYVVPRGKMHRPIADEPAHALLLERPETKQYGD